MFEHRDCWITFTTPPHAPIIKATAEASSKMACGASTVKTSDAGPQGQGKLRKQEREFGKMVVMLLLTSIDPLTRS